MQENDRYPVRFALFLMAYYITNCVYQNFLPLYLERSLGFTPGQRGTVFALIALVSLLTQPLWGARADRSRSRSGVIRLLCVLAAAAILCLLPLRALVPVFGVTCVFAAFYFSIQPLGDSVILGAMGSHSFGPIRLAGGLSFAVVSMVYGSFLDLSGDDRITVFMIAGLLMVTFCASFVLPKAPGTAPEGERAGLRGFRELLGNRELRRLLLFVLILQTTMGYFYSFFSNHFVKDLEGGSESLLGWCYFISAFCEIPYLLNSDRLFRKIGCGRLLCISSLCLTARWLIVGLSKDYRVVMCSQAFHGWGFIVITVSTAKYISETVPERLRSSGQMLLAVMSFGLSRGIGNLGGGLLADAMGMQKVFLICAGIAAASAIFFIPYYLCTPPLNGMPGCGRREAGNGRVGR